MNIQPLCTYDKVSICTYDKVSTYFCEHPLAIVAGIILSILVGWLVGVIFIWALDRFSRESLSNTLKYKRKDKGRNSKAKKI